MITTTVIHSSHLREILKSIHTAVTYHIHANPSTAFAWSEKWKEWTTAKIQSCHTLRSVATILYGKFTRAEHDISYILNTLRTELPVLDIYFSFNESNSFGGDQVMITKEIKYGTINFDFESIFTNHTVDAMVKLLADKIDNYLRAEDQLPDWTTKWYEWKGRKIMKATTVLELQKLIHNVDTVETDMTFEETLRMIIELIPILEEWYQFIFFSGDAIVVIMEHTNNHEKWETVAKHPSPTIVPTPYTTPSTSLKTNTPTNNSFAALEDREDDVNDTEVDPSPLSRDDSQKSTVSVKLQFESSSKRSDKTNSPPITMLTLTKERYNEIDTLMKAGNMDKISLAELEEYLTSNMTKSMDMINVELDNHKSQATKDTSSHKNKIKNELNKKVATAETKVKELLDTVNKFKTTLKQDESNTLQIIGEKGNKEISKIEVYINQAELQTTRLNTTINNGIAAENNIKLANRKIKDITSTGYNEFYADLKDIINDNKDDFDRWFKNKLEYYDRSEKSYLETIKIQQELMTSQKSAIDELMQKVAGLEAKVDNTEKLCMLHKEKYAKLDRIDNLVSEVEQLKTSTNLENNNDFAHMIVKLTDLEEKVGNIEQDTNKSSSPHAETPPISMPHPIPTTFQGIPAPSSSRAQPPIIPHTHQTYHSQPTQMDTQVNPPVNVKVEDDSTPMPKFKYGDIIHYKRGVLQFQGKVLESVRDTHNTFTYTLSVNTSNPHASPVLYCNCLENAITHIPSAPPLMTFNNNLTIPSDDSNSDINSISTPIPHRSNTTKTPDISSFADNEYQSPIDSYKKRINSPNLLKNSKNWTIIVNPKDDIKKLYMRLRSNGSYYNVPLKAWNEMTRNDENILTINPVNCLNFHNAKRSISQTLYDYFDMQKEKLFDKYQEPKYALTAFENDADGLGFLRHILTSIHPNLRQIHDYDKMQKPAFLECCDIHDFLAKYNEWLREEEMSNNRKYTDKENIDFILSELDSRFETARTKLQ